MSHLVGKMADTKGKQKTIVFFHPDLGIGGAERLVIDAAVGLQNRGYKIVIFTSYCDKGHCFEEARDGTLEVHVRGNTLIRQSYFSRFMILCAILRQAHLLLSIHWSGELDALAPDYFFVDQLSAGLPLLQYLRPRAPVLFYCHFPDLLLVQDRRQWWRRWYRVPFDAFERWSIGFADAIAVNSKFTRGVVGRTWPSLVRDRELKVVYPCIDTRPRKEEGNKVDWKEGEIILSINRFERKKDVALAIKAFAGLSKEQRKGVKLVIAGGYDSRVGENVSYHNDLVTLADSLHLPNATVHSIVTTVSVPSETAVIFLLSVPNALKQLLLAKARLLVYTPSNEHFGIVPLEAMLAGVPVLAANTGGPTGEHILEGVTGWLREPDDVPAWTAVMHRVLNTLSASERAAMRAAGVARVQDNFADTQLAQRVHDIYAGFGDSPPVRGSWAAWVSCVLAFLVTALVVSGGATLAVLWALYLTKSEEKV